MESVREAVESLNLTLVYGGFVLAGLLFCGLVFMFGGDHGDGGGAGDGGGGDHGGGGCFFSPTGVAIFMTSFGAFGLIFHNALQVTPLRSVVYSGVGGAVMMTSLTWVLYQVFVKSGSALAPEKLEGVSAEVYTAIPEDGTGEVVYRDSRGRQKAMARSADGKAIARGVRVRIESSLGATLLVARVDSGET